MPIGIPAGRDWLTACGAEWRFVTEPVQIADGLWVSGPIPRVTSFWHGDANLVTKEGANVSQDAIEDDLSVFTLRGDGLVVISGCAHAGMINIIRHGMEVAGAKKLAAG